MRFVTLFAAVLTFSACAHQNKKSEVATNPRMDQKQIGRQAIKSMAGCYLVDYNYIESEALKKGYQRDARLYDPNRNKAVKEWIYAEDTGQNKIRLQHILFSADPKTGGVVKGSELKHQAEDWEFDAGYLYAFAAPGRWEVKRLSPGSGWTRRITNLDDGLRYQCAANWTVETAYPEWSCDNFAPIPGRETRDMGRKDYDTLQRSTRVIAYGQSWLERQNNVKTIFDNGKRTPLAKESGKNWYVRVADQECNEMQKFAAAGKPFWDLLRNTWDEVLTGEAEFQEKTKPPRWAKMMAVEAEYLGKDLSKPEIRQKAHQDILKVIEEFRLRPAVKSAANAL